MYHDTIFLTNVLLLLRKLKMSKKQLSELSGVSISFLSDLTNGKGNPSLAVMEKIAVALNVPLAFLLESTDLDSESLKKLQQERRVQASDTHKGYEYVACLLPKHRAFVVKKWADEAQEDLNLNID